MSKHKIKILSEGNFMLPGVGFINGPVLSPYYETEEKIFKMLGNGVKIVEIMNDGSEKKLTITNYKSTSNVKKNVTVDEKPKANPNVVSIAVDSPKKEDEQQVQPEPEVKNDVTSEVLVVEDVKEEVTAEESVEKVAEEQPAENNKDNQYKYNKNKKHK